MKSVGEREPKGDVWASSSNRAVASPGKQTLVEKLAGSQGAVATRSPSGGSGETAPHGGLEHPPPDLEHLPPGLQRRMPATVQELFGRPPAKTPHGHGDPRDRAGGESPEAATRAAATRGIATPASALPFGDVIQRAFGRHDVSGVQAHRGGEAAASARAMGAQAYATGNHVVLGEDAGLHTVAHEAAHVVQQRHGVQLKGGVGAAGDAYEQHADAVADAVVQGKSAEPLLDTMVGGTQATPSGASPGTPSGVHGVQRQTYIRGCKSEADFNNDLDYLSRTSGLHDGKVDPEINNWLEGSGWTSSSRYNPGQRHYYSPVGLILEVTDKQKVLGNFSGDGNTSTLKQHRAEWVEALEAIRIRLNEIAGPEWSKQSNDVRSQNIKDQEQGGKLLQAVRNVLRSKDLGDQEKARTIAVLQHRGMEALRKLYQAVPRDASEQQKSRILGPGLDPKGLTEAEAAIRDAPDQVVVPEGTSTEIKYTESVLNVTKDDIRGTYYNADQGKYPDVIPEELRSDGRWSWLSGNTWLTRRRDLAGRVNGSLGKTLFEIKTGTLQPAPSTLDEPEQDESELFGLLLALSGAFSETL